jgi:hypothetical protein
MRGMKEMYSTALRMPSSTEGLPADNESRAMAPVVYDTVLAAWD